MIPFIPPKWNFISKLIIPPQWQFLAKFILILAITCIGGFSGWWVTSNYYHAEINALKAENSNAVNAELQRQQKLMADRAEQSRRAEAQHALDQLIINRLGTELSRVRVYVPSVGCGTMPGTGQAATDSNGASRVLYQRVDAAFAELQSGVGQLIQRCDQMNVDAIAANTKVEQNSANIK